MVMIHDLMIDYGLSLLVMENEGLVVLLGGLRNQ